MNAQAKNPILKPTQPQPQSDGLHIAAIYKDGHTASYALLQDAVFNAPRAGLDRIAAYEDGVGFLSFELETLEGVRA